jgi:hypothetical protein
MGCNAAQSGRSRLIFRRNVSESRALLSTYVVPCLFFDLEDGGDVPRKSRPAPTGLRGATSKETELLKKAFLEINPALHPSSEILISAWRNWRKLQRVRQEFVLSSDGLMYWRHQINYPTFKCNKDRSGNEEADYNSPRNLTCILFHLINSMQRINFQKLTVPQVAKKIPCLLWNPNVNYLHVFINAQTRRCVTFRWHALYLSYRRNYINFLNTRLGPICISV